MDHHSQFPLWLFVGLLAALGIVVFGAMAIALLATAAPLGLALGGILLVAAVVLRLRR
jgi:hypothetical protein